MGYQFRIGEETRAINMIGMADRVDQEADPGWADLSGKVDNLLGF